MARGVILSNRQIKAADRVGGATLMLPWPAVLPTGQTPKPDNEREASAAEKAAAETAVREAATAAKLVIVHVRVVSVRPPNDHPGSDIYQQRLAVLLIGRRWVHSSTTKIPPDIWPAQ